MPDADWVGKHSPPAATPRREGSRLTEDVGALPRATPKPHLFPKEHLISLYTHASLFICPSIYEPFGIINLEAMACGTPVVASAIGGIPEAVVHEETGLLVPFEPIDSQNFESGKYEFIPYICMISFDDNSIPLSTEPQKPKL